MKSVQWNEKETINSFEDKTDYNYDLWRSHYETRLSIIYSF